MNLLKILSFILYYINYKAKSKLFDCKKEINSKNSYYFYLYIYFAS